MLTATTRDKEKECLMAKFYYGGQAVMEGVMMRGRTSAAVAIRQPEGSIYLYEEALNPSLYKNRLVRLPFLRGVFLLWEMLVLGTRLMTFSANIATGAIDPDAPPSSTAGKVVAGMDGHGDTMGEEAETPPQIGGVGLILICSSHWALPWYFSFYSPSSSRGCCTTRSVKAG